MTTTNAAASIALEVGTSAAKAEVSSLRKELAGLKQDLLTLASATSGIDLQAGLARGAAASGDALKREAQATVQAVGGVLSTPAGEKLSSDFMLGTKAGVTKGLKDVEDEGVKGAKKAVASIKSVFDGVTVSAKVALPADSAAAADLQKRLDSFTANPQAAMAAAAATEQAKVALAEETRTRGATLAMRADFAGREQAELDVEIAARRAQIAMMTDLNARAEAARRLDLAEETRDRTAVLAMRADFAAREQAQAAAANAAALQNVRFQNGSLASKVGTLQGAAALLATPGADASAKYTPEILAQVDALPRLTAELDAAGAAHKRTGTATDANTVAARANKVAMDDLHGTARGLASQLGALWLTWGSVVPIAAAAAIGGALMQTFTIGKQVEYQLAFVRGMSEEVVKLNDLLAVTAGSQFTPKEGVEGLRALTQAGLTVKESLGVLPDVLNLAQLGEMSVGQAALTATGAVHAFGLSIADTAHVGDVFAKAAAISNTSVSGIAESMKTASTVADFYSISVEQTGAALATLAKRNIEGTSAGTALSNALRNLYAPTDAARKILQQLKLQISEGGKLKDFNVLLDELKAKLGGFNDQSRLQILTDLTSTRGAKAINSLITDLDLYKTALTSVTDSTGFLARAQAELADTTEGALKRLSSETESTFTRVFQQAQPQIVSLIDAITKLVQSTGFEDFLLKIVNGFARFGQVIGDHIGLITTLVAGYAGLRIALAASIQFTELAVAAELRLAAAEEATGIAAKAKALAMEASTKATVGNGVAQASNLAGLAGLLGGLSKLLGILGGVGLAISTVVTLWQVFSTSSTSAAAQTDALGLSMDHTTRVIEAANIALERQIGLRKQLANGDLKANPGDISADLSTSQSREDADRARLAQVQADRARLQANPAAFDRANKLYELGKEQLALETDINAQLTRRDALNRALVRNAESSIVNRDGAARDRLAHRGDNLAEQANGSNKTTQFVQPIQALVDAAKSGKGDIDELNRQLNEYQELVNKNLSNYVKPDKTAIATQNDIYAKQLAAAKAEFETVRQEEQLRMQGATQRAEADRKAGQITLQEEQSIDQIIADNYVQAMTGAAAQAMGKISDLHRGDKQVLEAFNMDAEAKRIASEMRIAKVRNDLAQQAAANDARLALAKETAASSGKLGTIGSKLQRGRNDDVTKFNEQFMSTSEQAQAAAAVKVMEAYGTELDRLNEAKTRAVSLLGPEAAGTSDEVTNVNKLIDALRAEEAQQIISAKADAARLDALKHSYATGAEEAFAQFSRAAEDHAAIAKSAIDGAFNSMSSALDTFVKTGKLDFKSLILSMIQGMAAAELKASSSGLFGFLGKLALGAITGGAGGGDASIAADSALSLNPNTFSGQGVTPYLHGGGIVGAEATFTKSMSPVIFSGAPRYHTGGVVGANEVPIVANRGEGVFTPAQMSALAPVSSGGDTYHIEVNNTHNIDSRSDQATIIRAMQQTRAQTIADITNSFKRDGQVARAART